MAQVVGFQTVPDSLRCLTPSQINRHISDAYVIRDLRTSLQLSKQTVIDLKKADESRQKQIAEAHIQEDLQHQNYNNCLVDMKVEKDKTKVALNKIKFQKVIIKISVCVAAVELVYIGFQSIRH